MRHLLLSSKSQHVRRILFFIAVFAILTPVTSTDAFWQIEPRGGLQDTKFSFNIGPKPFIVSELAFTSRSPRGELNLR
jgi:hypothetical protein